MVDIVPDLGPEAAADLAALYESHPPWGGRDPDDVREILAGTDVTVGIRDGGKLVASARVLTDYQCYAMVYEVVVAEDRRGEGLGRRVMDAVAAHPDLADVYLALHCREELVPFYQDCGFVLHDRDVEFPDGGTVTYRTMAYDRN